MTYQGKFEVQTSGHRDMQDITPHIASKVADAGIETGTAHVFVIGSTAAIGTIELEPRSGGRPARHAGQGRAAQSRLRPRARLA